VLTHHTPLPCIPPPHITHTHTHTHTHTSHTDTSHTDTSQTHTQTPTHTHTQTPIYSLQAYSYWGDGRALLSFALVGLWLSATGILARKQNLRGEIGGGRGNKGLDWDTRA